jgi:hypothetical protein
VHVPFVDGGSFYFQFLPLLYLSFGEAFSVATGLSGTPEIPNSEATPRPSYLPAVVLAQKLEAKLERFTEDIGCT